MAEIGIAASIIGVASTGMAVVSALTKFSISVRGANDKINYLAGRVSLTVSILESIATTVRNNASGFKEREFWRMWNGVLYSCEDSYSRIDQAVAKARGRSSGSDGDERKVSVWGKLVWALGGEAQMMDLENALETCCQQVIMMQQTIQLTVLSFLHQLTSDEAAERRELMGKLEWLLTGLSANGNLVLPGRNPDDRSAVIIRNDHLHQAPPFEAYSANRVPPPDGPTGSRGDLFGSGSGKPTANPLTLSSLLTIPSRRRLSSTPRQPQAPAPTQDSNSRRPAFEAFYILPRSLPRHQDKGEVQVGKANSDDYMIICVDVRGDYYKDKNVRDALRRTKEGGTPPTADEFPTAVQQNIRWLKNHRNRHDSDVTWSLVYGIKLDYLDESFFRRISSKSGFLIVLRGVHTSDGTRQAGDHRGTFHSRSLSSPDFTQFIGVTHSSVPKVSQRRYPVIVPERRYEDYRCEDYSPVSRTTKSHSRSRSRSRSSAGRAEDPKLELELENIRHQDRLARRRRREQRNFDLGSVKYGAVPVIVNSLPPESRKDPIYMTSSPSPDSSDDPYHDKRRYRQRLRRDERTRSNNGGSRTGRMVAHLASGVGILRARSEGVKTTRGSPPPTRERMARSDDESDFTNITRSDTLVDENTSRGRGTGAEVYISQEQAETVVMDFLATFADVKRDSF